MSPEVKAIVLLELIQKRYLDDHISDPRKYFPLLRRKNILSQAECSSIKKHEYQAQKFVELISLKEGGYDVFVAALKSLRVNAHVATHLKRRVSEVDKLYSQDQLPCEQQKLLTLHNFVCTTKLGHDYARDILEAKEWDLKSAVEAAREMGHCHGNMEVALETRHRDAEAVCDTLEQTSSPPREIGDVEDSCAKAESDVHVVNGALPPLPQHEPADSSNLTSGEGDLCAVDPEYGYLPSPPQDHTPVLLRDHSPVQLRDHTPALPPWRAVSTPPAPQDSILQRTGSGGRPQQHAQALCCPSPHTQRGPHLSGSSPLLPVCPTCSSPFDISLLLAANLAGFSAHGGFSPTDLSRNSFPPPCLHSSPPTHHSYGSSSSLPSVNSSSSLPRLHNSSPSLHDSSPPPPRPPKPGPPPLPPKRAKDPKKLPKLFDSEHSAIMAFSQRSMHGSSSSLLSVNNLPRLHNSSPFLHDSFPPPPQPPKPHNPFLFLHDSSPHWSPPLPPKRAKDPKKLPKLFDQSVTGKHSPEHNGARRNVPQVSMDPTSNQPSPLQSPGHAVSGNAAGVRAKHKPMTGQLWAGTTQGDGQIREFTAHSFFARHKPMTDVTLVPDVKPYLMEMTDDEAVKTIGSIGQPGMFFIRPSNKDGVPFSLCITDADGRGGVKLLKYHIRESPKGYHVDEDRSCFLSISNLVQHYQRNPIVPATGTKLTTPLRDASPASPDYYDDKPTMRLLQSMRDKDDKEIRTIDETAPEWNHVAVALDFAPHTTALLEKNNPGNALQACYNMFATWIDRCIDVTWDALVGALRRAGFRVLAQRIEAAKML